VTPPLFAISRPAPDQRREVRDFAASVRDAARGWSPYDRWSPTAPCDDSAPDIRASLDSLGWSDLAEEPDALDFVAAAAVELGRVAAPLDVVDRLLGRPLALGPGLAGGITLGRYAGAGDAVWVCDTEGPTSARVVAAAPVGYVDSVGAAWLEVEPTTSSEGPAEEALRAWTVATAGYAGGLTATLHDLAATHALERQAFGGVLADLDVVAAKLADTAMASEGILMALEDAPGPDLVRHAVRTAVTVSKTSQQLHGGLGFTLEFPLQRFSRRAWALESWTLAVLEPMTSRLRWVP
jgi:hypothetical protein